MPLVPARHQPWPSPGRKAHARRVGPARQLSPSPTQVLGRGAAALAVRQTEAEALIAVVTKLEATAR